MARTVKPQRPYDTGLRREQALLTRHRIIEAARRLFVSRGYSSVTMDEIAKEAGVAYQTVYSVFGTKLGVAQGIIWTSFEAAGVEALIAKTQQSTDPRESLRSGARIPRVINERLADLLRFMRESGDPELLAEYHKVEDLRFKQQKALLIPFFGGVRLREGISASDAVAVMWAMTGADIYLLLVSGRGWTPSHYEKWLGEALINHLLEPG